MFRQRVPLSMAMKLVALVALNLALVRVFPDMLQYPVLLFALVMIDLLVVRLVILARPLNSFHTKFFVVGLVASVALALLTQANSPRGSLHILVSLIALIHWGIGEPPWPLLALLPDLPEAERCLTSALGIVLAWAAGLGMAHLERRSRIAFRRIHSFVQGGAIGLGVFVALATAYARMVQSPLSVSVVCWGFAISLGAGGVTVVLLRERRRAAETTGQS